MTFEAKFRLLTPTLTKYRFHDHSICIAGQEATGWKHRKSRDMHRIKSVSTLQSGRAGGHRGLIFHIADTEVAAINGFFRLFYET